MTAATKSTRRPVERRPFVPNAVLAVLIFVASEVMLFAALISAFVIASSSAIGGWPPPDQPRLPVGETAFNTAALLISGLFVYLANRAFRDNARSARTPLLIAILLGAFFVTFQGIEWVQLLDAGLTMTSSTHGGFFYLIVGLHAAHAIAAIIALVFMYVALLRGKLEAPTFWAASIFWYFVVGVWPVLYYLVYL